MGCVALATVVLLPETARANCVASEGSPTLIEADDVTVTCNTEEPNPFTSGIGSEATNTNLEVDIATDAAINTSGVGVSLDSGGSLSNSGTVTATGTAVSVSDALGSVTPDIDNDGSLVSSEGAGIDIATGFADASIDNTGSIQAGTLGVRMGTGRLDNSGTIDATSATGTAVESAATATVTNSGTITSSGAGLRLGASSTVDNSGEITASGNAVDLSAGSTLTNTGSITSSGGIALTAGGNASLVNSGSLSGSETAVSLTGGNNTLTLNTGTSVSGAIRSVLGPTPGIADSLVLEGQGSLDNTIEGFGSLTMRGESWRLGGDVSAAQVNIESGSLTINGILSTGNPGSAGQVALSQGTLAGTGRIVADVDNSSGTVAAGDSVGTLTIDGNYAQGGSGRLRVASSPGSGVGLLQVTGTATLAGTVEIQAGSDGIYEFLTADGGIDGEFDELVVDGRALVTLIPSGNSLSFVRASTTVEDNMVFAAIDAAVLTLDGLQTGGRSAGESGLWIKPVGHWGDKEEEEGVPGGDFWIYGAMGGFDWSFANDRVRVGAGGGYTTTDLDIDDGGEGEADNTVYGAYLEYVTERFHGSLTISGGSNEFEHERSIFVNEVRNTAEADYDGDTLALRLAIGGNMPLEGAWGDNWLFEPELRADYIVLDIDPYIEDGGTGLEVEATDDIEAAEFGGLFHVRRTNTRGLGVAPRLHIGVVHRIAIDDREWSAVDAASGVSLLLPGDDEDSTYFRFGVGGDFDLGQRWRGYVDYLGEVGDGGQGHSLVAGIKLRF